MGCTFSEAIGTLSKRANSFASSRLREFATMARFLLVSTQTLSWWFGLGFEALALEKGAGKGRWLVKGLLAWYSTTVPFFFSRFFFLVVQASRV